MIKSMTGFGRYERTEDGRRLTIEIKSVNHRYFDAAIKLSKSFCAFENNLRNILKKYAVRGKIDVFVSYEDMGSTNVSLKFNKALAEEYLECFREMEKLGLKNDITVASLSKFPEVLIMQDSRIDEEEMQIFFEQTMERACELFVESRIREGENLRKDILKKLEDMMIHVTFIEERFPRILEEYRQKLKDKMGELLENSQIDEARIATELVLFADKICVDEEIVRLKSHISAMKEELQNGMDSKINETIGYINHGKKLDFLAQEMNREANTILSKANNLEITNHGIELKTDIEKIREQVQNIE
ncbi:MAG: YicC family protein [Lachnospiraceae bacterium]|mgnify:CR=1 FL=1|jgi:TIGR00255 family protein|nr:YicC family protein [Lachnospiraceae bacterium]MCI9371713.1 YicC family protein [Lachnospiraceae bacterium]